MKETLVLGFYEDTGGTYAYAATTEDRQGALRAAARDCEGGADLLLLLGTVQADGDGRLEFEPVGEDSGTGAYAVNLLEVRDDGDDRSV